jgi:hypothetical protein
MTDTTQVRIRRELVPAAKAAAALAGQTFEAWLSAAIEDRIAQAPTAGARSRPPRPETSTKTPARA